ncbi:MAG TPA: hypothetical protein VNA20_04250 [Frankiaceae bacterium]|nr:hypothetical protein [Frankiaceae bacterium]
MGVSTPAHALVQPPMNITVAVFSTYHRVCGIGTADPSFFAAGQWVLAIHGSRSNGQAIDQVVSVPGRTINTTNGCMNVLKFGATQGQYQASLTFVGAGLDVIGERVAYGAWQPSVLSIGTDLVLNPQVSDLVLNPQVSDLVVNP